ncbi:uncharacterized protein L3040_001181 [Drepanopeziza brunnea f. sp. 'multigermtubi']|uniref:uncharacterized protein n=1 Tax=Drepanopeziza brunnea f. sp. 'multigermtubi' TaxID=698441 RepID=UPI00239AA80E|nr:hypothetical protein L3040_001181 [Drepanopeziza brunnea f. sp. 'multigermtubi']
MLLRPLSRRPLFQLKNPSSRTHLRCLRCLSTATESSATHHKEQQRQQQHHAPTTSNHVQIVEVGPRDGLQNEKTIIPLTTKIELIERLAKTGLRDIEAGSFVAPKWVPQMADSSEILSYLLKHPPNTLDPISYSFLAPNAKGLQNALAILKQYPKAYQTFSTPSDPSKAGETPSANGLAVGAEEKKRERPFIEISVFAAATETFTQKNLNTDIATSLLRFQEVIAGAKGQGLRVRAYISVVLGCPFEGYDVDPHRVAEMACSLMEMGADEIDLGDTTGMGTAPRTAALLRALSAAGIRNEDLTMHFHDTYGQALVNTAVSLEHGVRRFDSSVGGLGGCPYSPGATGNVSTEDLVYFMESLGMETGVDLDGMAEIGAWITGEMGKANGSLVGKAILGKRRKERGGGV